MTQKLKGQGQKLLGKSKIARKQENLTHKRLQLFLNSHTFKFIYLSEENNFMIIIIQYYTNNFEIFKTYNFVCDKLRSEFTSSKKSYTAKVF